MKTQTQYNTELEAENELQAETTIPDNLVDRIEAKLAKINRNINNLCEHTGISRVTFWHWKKDPTKCRVGTLKKINDAITKMEKIHAVTPYVLVKHKPYNRTDKTVKARNEVTKELLAKL